MAEDRDFESLEKVAPFVSRLSQEDRLLITETLRPYAAGQRLMDVRQQGLKSTTVFLSTGNKEDKTLILSLQKARGGEWVISDNISYQQTIEFVPLEKKE